MAYNLGAPGDNITFQATLTGNDCCSVTVQGADTTADDSNCTFSGATLSVELNCASSKMMAMAPASEMLTMGTSSEMVAMVASPSSSLQGPGTELAKLISWFVWKPNCGKCRNRVAKMNAWGPEKCRENIDTIKRWLKWSAKQSGLPYNDRLVTILINKAIRNAERNAR